MALYLIGIGLYNYKDITLRGFEVIKKADVIYFENYTSFFGSTLSEMEQFLGKKILPAGRVTVEADQNEIITAAKKSNVALLVIGDALSATTHIDLMMRAQKEGIAGEIIHNSSIITAVAVTGLQLYKFGKVSSIPLQNENIKTPYDVLRGNLKGGMHTLLLLDLNPLENTFVSIPQAISYLLRVEKNRRKKIISPEKLLIGGARIGYPNQIIKAGTFEELVSFDFGNPPHCLIVPADLHFMEEECLQNFRFG